MDLRVLLVTPDFVESSACRRALLACGCRVATAATFERAALLSEEADIVIAAGRLGGFTGVELGALVEQERTGATVAILSDADEALEREAHTHGFEFLLRPILPADLAAFIEWRRRVDAPPVPAFADGPVGFDAQNAGG